MTDGRCSWGSIVLAACGLAACGAAEEQPLAPEIEEIPLPSCAPSSDDFPVRPAPAFEATLPPLRVSGTDIVDDEGQRVALRGTNFGSWLQIESWIAGIGLLDEEALVDELVAKANELGVGRLLEDARESTALAWLLVTTPHRVLVRQWRVAMYEQGARQDREAIDELWRWFDEQPWIFEEESLWLWLEHRFGEHRRDQLRDVFADNYITELDVARVAGLGLNLIRLPVWYAALEHEVDGHVRFREQGWQQLDQLVTWARKHRVYVMIDLHGAPGGQSADWHQGSRNGGSLWSRPECQDRTARLWQAIAAYFADEPHVAVYDLLNEPMRSPSAEDYALVHDAIYRAIRQVDTAHIIMIEDGYLGDRNVRSPLEMGWENAMFSIHTYLGGGTPEAYRDKVDETLQDWAAEWDRFDCPLFLGEFSSADSPMGVDDTVEGMDLALAMLNDRGVHWAPWSWKFHQCTLWGLYCPASGAPERVDVRDASFDEIEAGFARLSSANFAVIEGYEAALRARGADPVAPLQLD